MLAARAQAIRTLKQKHPFVEEGHLLSKLMAYCSKEAHSCVEKAAMISFVKLRILEPDSKCSLRGETLTKVRNLVHKNVNQLSIFALKTIKSLSNSFLLNRRVNFHRILHSFSVYFPSLLLKNRKNSRAGEKSLFTSSLTVKINKNLCMIKRS